jgi:hypothetical protein
MLHIGVIGDRRTGTTRLRQTLAEALASEHIQIVSRGEGEALDTVPPDEALVLEACRKLGDRAEHDELLITALTRLLQRYAPLFCRVGPRAEEPAAFGCWVDRPALDQAVAGGAVLRVNELRAVPRADAHAYVLVQEAGGKMSFHVRGVEGAKLIQVWRSE